MDTLRVFVVSNNLIFGQGLKNLLSQDPRFEIIGEERDIDQAIPQIERLLPDVVIWGGANHVKDAMQEGLRLLKAKSGIKVISLSLQSNVLFVYYSTRKTVRTVEDLLEAIASDLPSSEQPVLSNKTPPLIKQPQVQVQYEEKELIPGGKK